MDEKSVCVGVRDGLVVTIIGEGSDEADEIGVDEAEDCIEVEGEGEGD